MIQGKVNGKQGVEDQRHHTVTICKQSCRTKQDINDGQSSSCILYAKNNLCSLYIVIISTQ